MSTILGESIVKAKINHGDFIMLHKAEIKSIVTNAEIVNLKSEISEKIGTFILGLSTTLYFVPNMNIYTVAPSFILGCYFTYTSIMSKIEKNKLIKQLIDDKLEDSKLFTVPPVSIPD